jgi:hypothetical protein
MTRLFSCLALALIAIPASAQTTSTATFHRDVQPILQRHCQSCHRPGQLGPMALETYQQARPWARAIRTKVADRSMPPWFADPAHGSFTNDRSLKQAEIDTIQRWVDGGAVEGDAKDAPPPVTWPANGWQIKPDVEVPLPEVRVPAKGVVEWESLALPFPSKTDAWVTSLEILPGTPAVVHHICVGFRKHRPDVVYGRFEWEDQPRNADGTVARDILSRVTQRFRPDTFKARQAGSTEVQTLPGRSSLASGATMCYVPGLSTHDYRVHDAAKFVPAGSDIVITFHYQTIGKPAVDRTKLGLTFARQPPRRKFVEIAANAQKTLAIPPNEPDYALEPFEIEIKKDAQLVWMWPHMHYRGKSVTYTIIQPSGRRQVVLRVPKYDADWQLAYLTSVPIAAGSRLRAEARYDNSRANKANPDPSAWVYPGQQSWEEMFTPAFGLVVGRDVDERGLTSKFVAEGSGG